MRRCGNMRDKPHCEHKQTDVGEVRIAVRVALFSNLDEANHGDKHTDIPEPSGEEIRSFPSENDCCDSHREKQSNREKNFPNCQSIVWVRVENGEACRPQCFPNVNHVSHDRVFYAPEERQRWDRTSSAFLQDKCDDTRTRGNGEHGNLFKKEVSSYTPLITGFCGFRSLFC